MANHGSEHFMRSAPLLSLRERCHDCGEKLILDDGEAEFLAGIPGSRLVAYFCPMMSGWHVADENDPRLFELEVEIF